MWERAQPDEAKPPVAVAPEPPPPVSMTIGADVYPAPPLVSVMESTTPVKFAVSAGEYLCRRRGRAERVAEAIDCATFQIDTGEKRSLDAFLTFAQKLPRLLGTLDIAGKQNHTGGL